MHFWFGKRVKCCGAAEKQTKSTIVTIFCLSAAFNANSSLAGTQLLLLSHIYRFVATFTLDLVFMFLVFLFTLMPWSSDNHNENNNKNRRCESRLLEMDGWMRRTNERARCENVNIGGKILHRICIFSYGTAIIRLFVITVAMIYTRSK